MKISVIMPTYNHAAYITQTLDSLISQTYSNWELIIVDDGSSDNTKEIIKNYKKANDKDNKIKYIYQENADQLNAIINGIKNITGQYVFVLHSDDLLPDNSFFTNCVDYMEKNNQCDAIIGDLISIDSNSNIIGDMKVNDYVIGNKVLPTLLIWLGRNFYTDVAFYKKEVFIDNVLKTYLNWNMPFWIKFDKKIEMLNIKKVSFPLLMYRQHGNNYINNEIGKLNVINGELRAATLLMKNYHMPFYKIQYFIFRVFNKLKIQKKYIPIYFNREQKKKDKIVKFIIEKRFDKEYKNNIFLNNLISFYANYKKRSIKIEIDDNEIIYKGKDVRAFNKKLIDHKLSDAYIKILSEMKFGFDEIVTDAKNVEKMENITKFLCIYPYVKVTISK